MTDALERFHQAADALGVDVESQAYPEGTRTAADAAAAIGCDVAQIVKSLVFVADDTPVLALVSGANRLDESALARTVGADRVRKADADEVRSATGFAIGGTPPFGHPQALRTVIDRDLLGHDRVWAAAGTPRDNFPITPDRLVEVTGGDVADIAER